MMSEWWSLSLLWQCVAVIPLSPMHICVMCLTTVLDLPCIYRFHVCLQVPNTPIPLPAPPSRSTAADEPMADRVWPPENPPAAVSAAPAAVGGATDNRDASRGDGEHVPVTTEELVRAFAEASDLRMRALGAVGLVEEGGGRGHKRRRVDGGRTFHPTIGIGNVGKKGGSDVPGGVQVSMVALCDYILRNGGWENVRPTFRNRCTTAAPALRIRSRCFCVIAHIAVSTVTASRCQMCGTAFDKPP